MVLSVGERRIKDLESSRRKDPNIEPLIQGLIKS